MPDEYEVKIRRKSEAEKDLEDVADKVQAGAKTVANKPKMLAEILTGNTKRKS